MSCPAVSVSDCKTLQSSESESEETDEKPSAESITSKVDASEYIKTSYEKLDDAAAATQQFQLAINRMSPERFFIVRIGNTFTNLNQLDWAIKTYEKGAIILNDNLVFSYYLADLFRRKGDGPKMINQYLNVVSSQADRMDNIQMIFQRYLLKEDYKELKKQIYERIQLQPDAIVYPELLIWLLLQERIFQVLSVR